ncbi:MAG: DUF2079 domain-containing protein [Solirubrobacteraceae bacterium]
MGIVAALDAAASIIRFVHLQSGLDLALFDQAVWHYSRFEAPFSSIKGFNLLGDHFHPLVAVLAPLYWVWSDPRTLLIAQSLLVAASIVPVFLFARPRVGRAGAYLLAGAYAVFWGLQAGVQFDFHEVAFAPLLIALTILLADRRRWGWFWLVVVLLALVKEDMSIFVVFLGIYLLTQRELRHGIALVLAGIAWYELTTRVFIPRFAGGGSYGYWTYGELGTNPLTALEALIRAPWRVFAIGFSPAEKAHTILALLAPFLFLSLWSRLFILALPLLAERFLSTNASFWGTSFHYSLTIAPVLAMAAAAGLANLGRLLAEPRRRTVTIAGAAAMLVVSLAVTRLGVPGSALSQITRPSFYNAEAFDAGALPALREVPSTASLATTDYILPHASQRERLRLIDPQTVGLDQYLIVNVTDPGCCGSTGNGTYVVLGQVLDRELRAMTPTYYQSGWLVARRPPAGQSPTSGVLTPMSTPAARTINLIALRWHHDLNVAIGGFIACYEEWTQHSPAAATCFGAADRPLQRRQNALSAAVHAALPTLGNGYGCLQLAHAELVDTHQLTLDLRRLAPAAASPRRSALSAALSAAQTDDATRDLSGALDRFTILCTPRAGSGQPSSRAAAS